MRQRVAEVSSGVITLGAMLGLSACQGEKSRLDPVDPGKPGTGGAIAGGGGGSSGTAGASGSTAADAGTVDVTGIVTLLGSEFAELEIFAGKATVVGETPSGAFATGSYGGLGTKFTISGLLDRSGIWLGAEPAQKGATFGGFWPVDPTSGQEVAVPVVQRTAIDEIFAVLLATVGAEPGRAHIILEIQDSAGPRSGLSVKAATGATLAYAAGGGWSDNATATDTNGAVAILNVGAVAFPGSEHTFELSQGDAGVGAVRVRVAAECVTVVSFLVDG